MLDRKTIIREITGGKPVSSHKIAGMAAALDWIDRNTICILKAIPATPYRDKVADAINRTLTEIFNLDPAYVFSKSRKRDKVLMRARSMLMYIELTGTSLKETAATFGNVVDHPTLIHYRHMLDDLNAYNRKERIISELFREKVLHFLAQDGAINQN